LQKGQKPNSFAPSSGGYYFYDQPVAINGK